MFSRHPLDFSRDSKLIHTSSIGAEVVMLTSYAAFVGAFSLLMQLPNNPTLCLMSLTIQGQKKRFLINYVIRSLTCWHKSSWYALKAVSINVIGSTNWPRSSPLSVVLLYSMPSFRLRFLKS